MQTPWGTVIDYVIKLLPAGSIIVAAAVARQQILANRRGTAITIAKNHYKDLLYLFEQNVDILYGGINEDRLMELRADIYNYRRYRWLVTITLFSLQELYFTLRSNSEWRHTICVISSIFRAYLLSTTELSDFIRRGWDPEFMRFLMEGLRVNEHPFARMKPGDGKPTPIRVELVEQTGKTVDAPIARDAASVSA